MILVKSEATNNHNETEHRDRQRSQDNQQGGGEEVTIQLCNHAATKIIGLEPPSYSEPNSEAIRSKDILKAPMFVEFQDESLHHSFSLEKQTRTQRPDPDRERLIASNDRVIDSIGARPTYSMYDIFNFGIMGLCNNLKMFEILLSHHPNKKISSSRKIVNV